MFFFKCTSFCTELIIPSLSQVVPKCILVPIGNRSGADGYCVGSHV